MVRDGGQIIEAAESRERDERSRDGVDHEFNHRRREREKWDTHRLEAMSLCVKTTLGQNPSDQWYDEH
jgi:hypothetical protein